MPGTGCHWQMSKYTHLNYACSSSWAKTAQYISVGDWATSNIRAHFSAKMSFFKYKKSHCRERWSCTGKRASFYQHVALISKMSQMLLSGMICRVKHWHMCVDDLLNIMNTKSVQCMPYFSRLAPSSWLSARWGKGSVVKPPTSVCMISTFINSSPLD